MPLHREDRAMILVENAEGRAVPFLDVTDPVFGGVPSPEKQRGALETFRAEQVAQAKVPRLLRGLVLRFFLRRSELGRRIQRSRGTFMSAEDTYMLKLGAEGLGPNALEIDRKIAASLPVRAARWRVFDVAELVAGAAARGLTAGDERRLHLFEIAGGTGVTSLNALLLLARDRPELLRDRTVEITMLDRDRAASGFGERALAALQGDGRPLASARITWRFEPYDWARPAELGRFFEAHADRSMHVVGASEGGLFEYGTDREITTNLEALRDAMPDGFAIAGSVTRDDDVTRLLRANGGVVTTKPRGLEVFTRLAESAGFSVARAIERPFSDQVLLEKKPI